MTTYNVSIGKNGYQIEINRNQIKIDGKVVQTALTKLGEEGLYLLSYGTSKQELHVQSQGPHQYGMDLNGRHMVARVEKNNGQIHRKTNAATASDITAPMPGVIISVHTAEGDNVEEGQVLVVLESMKMQMMLRASGPGKVIRVNAQPNAQTAKGDVLVKIEKTE